MIVKLEGREKIQWITVADKVNEIIDLLNFMEAEKERRMRIKLNK